MSKFSQMKTVFMPVLSTLMLLIVLASCNDAGDSISYDDAKGIYITAGTLGFLVRNISTETVYFHMLEYERSKYEDPGMPSDSTHSIAPGGTRNVPYITIRGYSHNCKVFVWLWNATGGDPSIPRTGSGRTFIIKAE